MERQRRKIAGGSWYCWHQLTWRSANVDPPRQMRRLWLLHVSDDHGLQPPWKQLLQEARLYKQAASTPTSPRASLCDEDR